MNISGSLIKLYNALLQRGSANDIAKMLNHKKQYERNSTLKPDCLETVAIIYKTNSEGTIFPLQRETLKQHFSSQTSELNAL